MEFDGLYEKILEDDFGLRLAEVPVEEILHTHLVGSGGRSQVEFDARNLLSQLNAHPFPVWLEQLDVKGAFEELRLVGACGFAGQAGFRSKESSKLIGSICPLGSHLKP